MKSLLVALMLILCGLQGQAFAGKAGPMVKVQDAEDSAGYFWKMKVGSKSTYTMVFTVNGAEVAGPELTVEVMKVDGKFVAYHQEAAGHADDYAAGESNGFYCWGEVEDGKFKPVMALVKFGSKKGDTWDGWAGGKKDDQPEVTVKHMGTETLKTKAGELKDCLHIQATVKDGPVMDFWFAPGKGMVKQSMSMDGAERRRFELTSFTEGK